MTTVIPRLSLAPSSGSTWHWTCTTITTGLRRGYNEARGSCPYPWLSIVVVDCWRLGSSQILCVCSLYIHLKLYISCVFKTKGRLWFFSSCTYYRRTLPTTTDPPPNTTNVRYANCIWHSLHLQMTTDVRFFFFKLFFVTLAAFWGLLMGWWHLLSSFSSCHWCFVHHDDPLIGNND